MPEDGVVLDKLGKMVAVHLGHLNIADDAADVVFDGIPLGLGLLQVGPRLLAVVGHRQVDIPGLPQRLGNHPGQQHGVFRQEDGLFAALAGSQLVDVIHLDAQLGADLRDDLLEVQDGDKVIFKICNAGGDPFLAPIDNLVRLLDLLPGDPGDAHHRVDMERKVVVIEVGDDEDVPLRVGGRRQVQVASQVDNGNDHIPGFEDALDIRLGLLHGLYRAGHHNLQDLCHVDAEGLSGNGELHDLQFIGAGFQKDLCLSFHLHCSLPPSVKMTKLPYDYLSAVMEKKQGGRGPWVGKNGDG